MAITANQIQGAIDTTTQLASEVQQLSTFLHQLLELANNGFQITRNIGGVQVTVTLTGADQSNLLTQYNTLKSAMVSTFGNLP